MGSWVEKEAARHVEADELRRAMTAGLDGGERRGYEQEALKRWTKEGVRKVA